MGTWQFPVVFTPGEDGYVVAECPVLPGCISQGRTKQEALENIKEAILLCLESADAEGWSPPAEYQIEQVEVTS